MQAVNEGTNWMLRLETGEDLLGTLGRFAEDHGIRAAAIAQGIGQLRTAALGFWNGQEYVRREVAEPTELVALSGSIAEDEGRPSVHVHATLGGSDHSAVAGHVLGGTVGLLAEILVVTFPSSAFERPMDESLGLRTLRLTPDGPPGRAR
jgi:uncharacterized protein